ncbi:MAG: exodeoxyribonuclease V subunit gamma, partial [Propionibacteriaceae bacterium]|nr:exodeoxyribonuclease V subunit gamma [Propionibacteriaceae bacterium]
LAQTLIAEMAKETADPFDQALVVIPNVGMRRWLSQQIANSESRICAGINFIPMTALANAVSPTYTKRQLTLAIFHTLEGNSDFPQLKAHFANAREPFTAIERIASQFLSYLANRPQMLASWEAGQDTYADGELLGFQAWQAQLWRAVKLQLTCAKAPINLPNIISIFCPTSWSASNQQLVSQLGSEHKVNIYFLNSAPTVTITDRKSLLQAGHSLNQALHQQTAEISSALAALAKPIQLESPPCSNTLLGQLQSNLRNDSQPPLAVVDPNDRSVRIQLSHGLDRQVEVLRDTLADLLQSDPSLEPRDIVIITPALEAVAPLITSCFGLGVSGLAAHPAHSFRVQVANAAANQANAVADLLLRLLNLIDTRITATQILDLCADQLIAKRFGFDKLDMTRLEKLIDRAQIKWGLNSEHRKRFELNTSANTWIFGIQRLTLSVALSDQELTSVKNVVPIDDVDSSDLPIIGALSELIRRLSAVITAFLQPNQLREWVVNCLTALKQLVDPRAEGLSSLVSLLGEIDADATAGANAVLSRHGFIHLLETELANLSGYSMYGNGSALVVDMKALRQVPHRVVCLLGWDAQRFPQRRRTSGDDLLTYDPQPCDLNPALEYRQILAEASQPATQN